MGIFLSPKWCRVKVQRTSPLRTKRRKDIEVKQLQPQHLGKFCKCNNAPTERTHLLNRSKGLQNTGLFVYWDTQPEFQ